jgi:hypothetical protein
MNTAELDSYRLADAVKFNKQLNPRLWQGDRMLPQVREKLLEIAADFKQSLGLSDLEVKDITVSGSNAGFTYTPHSDIDLHLVVDIPQADTSDVYRELFDAKKYQYNAEHNITIGGHDVELYVENANVPPVSQGVYSIMQDDWINIPKRRRSTVNDDAVRSKYADIKHRIQQALDSRDHEQISAMAAKIKKMRTAGLAQSGELGPENLAYKMLRTQGLIKRLYDARTAARDLELSLNERRKKKKQVRYGFWSPGFAFSDSGDGGGGGGGGESIREVSVTPDGVSPSTKMFLEQDSAKDIDILKSFAKYVSGELGLAKMPKIIVKRRPDWAEQNGSFGQYVPELNQLTLSLHGRHIVDVLRTLAHELTHAHQQQTTGIPDNGGDTGSEFENEANARAGEFMRHFADAHPEYFDSKTLEEGMVKNAGAAIALAAAMAMTPAQAQQYLPQDQQQQVQQQGQLNTMQILNIARTIHSLKHNVTRAGAEEEINQEVKNYIRATQGDPGAQNLSRVWQMQQRQQQRQQPQQQPWTGNQYQREDIAEASGYIPTDAEKNDPRFVMALSPDVRPGATGKNANKMALKTDSQGRPALLMKTANLREGRMPQPSQGPGKYRDLNEPLGPETPPTMPAGTVRIDVSDMYDWYKLGQHISNMKGLGKHDFGAGPPSSVISFGDEETEHKFIKDLKATGLDVTDIDPKDPKQPAGMRKIKTDPTYNVSEAFDQPYPIKWEKSEYGDYDALATLDDGTHLSIMFEHTTPYEVAVSFWRNNSQEVTGEGDAQRIFATVLAAIQQFLKQEQPANISFSAVKEDDPTGSRSKLYNKLVQRYAANWGYQARSFDHDDKVEFELTKIRQNVDEDELVESLRQEFALLEDEYLGEIKMTGKNLQAEAAKTGAQAGMEFEMIVPNTETDVEPEYEPDYDQDSRARSFSQIRDFFHDGDYNGRREADNLIEELTGEYEEWVQEQIDESWGNDGIDYIRDFVEVNDLFDRDEAMAQARDEVITANPDLPQESEDFTQLLSARLDELQEQFVLEAFEDQGRIFNDAFESFADEQREEYDERSFLDDKYPYMTDIQNNFDISWPYYYDINDGQDGEMDIDQVADDFSNFMGKPVNASRQYHGGRREAGHYVVEPDGSLEGDNPGDGGLEFVSPPMPIDEMISDLNKVKEWAGQNGCYTNDSTGLHINISVPNYSIDKLDYVKLAILMGDEYILDLFGRSGNTYAKSAMGKIKTALKQKPEAAAQIMDLMKQGLDGAATKAIHTGVTNKYTSINTKTGYIEFRSPGGDWLDANFANIENTLLRFTVALSAAIDPEAYRKEYLTKLYKLLSEGMDKSDTDIIQLFSNYSAGDLDKAALIRQVRQKQLARDVNKGKATGKMWWSVSRPGYFASIEVVASSKEEAIDIAVQPSNYPDWARDKNTLKATPIRPYEAPSAQGNWGIWLDGAQRFARIPRSEDGSDGQSLRKFDSESAARTWLNNYRDRNPGIRSDIDIREIPADYQWPPAADAESTQASSTGNWRIKDGLGRVIYTFRPRENTRAAATAIAAAWTGENNFDGNYTVVPSDDTPADSATTAPAVNRNTLAPTGPGPWEVFRRSDGSSVAELGQTNRMSAEVEARRVIDQRREAPELYGVRTATAGNTDNWSADFERRMQSGDLTPQGPGPWEVASRSNNQVYYNPPSSNPIEAESQSLTWLRQNGHNEADFEVRTREGVNSTDASQDGIIDIGPDISQYNAPQTLTRPGQGQQTFTGEWQVLDPEDREIYRFSGVGNNQSDANRVAINWLRQNPGRMQAGVTVVPVMG